LAFASHFDRVDAEHRANAAGKPVDGVAVIDVDGGRYSVPVRVRPGGYGCETKPGNARLIEQAAKGGMHVAGAELEKKHDGRLSRSAHSY
jgi:hypothetical protein